MTETMYPGDNHIYYPLEIVCRRGDNGNILVCKTRPTYEKFEIVFEIDFSKCLSAQAEGKFKTDGTQDELKVSLLFNHCKMEIKPIEEPKKQDD